MSQRTCNPNADASANNLGRRDRFIATDRAGLTHEFQLGRDPETSRINLANPNIPGAWSGAPTFPAPRVASLSADGYMVIPSADAIELTVIAAVGVLGAFGTKGAMFLGNYQGGGGSFFMGWGNGNGPRAVFPRAGGLQVGATNPARADEGLAIYALRTTGNAPGTWKMDGFAAGALVHADTGAFAGARVVDNQPMRIGGPSNYGSGVTLMHGLAIYSGRCMTDAELAAEVSALTMLAAATGDVARALTRPAAQAVIL